MAWARWCRVALGVCQHRLKTLGMGEMAQGG